MRISAGFTEAVRHGSLSCIDLADGKLVNPGAEVTDLSGKYEFSKTGSG